MSGINDAVPQFSRWGSSIKDYVDPRISPETQRIFWDANKDNPLGATNYVNKQIGRAASGQNPWSDTEYNQNIAKRAAMVAAVFGGAALAGGGAAANAAAPTLAAESGTIGSAVAPTLAAESGTIGGASMAPAYGVGAGNVGGLGLTSSGGATGAAAPSVLAGSTAGSGIGTMGSSAMNSGIMLGAGKGGAATAGSWGPYAQAGATILSNLFTGLMQMEQQKEQQEYDRKMMQAKSHVERANAQNAALDRLINVWQGARR